ncbi:MAG: patatin-like phospholipase family protein [Deltaproteobacteria bacterium]|nr:patatin-like phospholipase family protein [Deltaproteobacteria bacterium]
MIIETQSQKSLAVVLAGGGCMTFWSLGALHHIEKYLPPVSEWAGVSAGAAMAVAACAKRIEETKDFFVARTDANKRNIHLVNIFGKQPVFPHEEIYRSTILHALENGGFETFKTSAPVRILLSYFEEGASTLKTVFGAAMAYRKRKKNQIIHGPDEPFPGLVEEIATAQECKSENSLCDIIMASSCTPPITSIQVIGGRSYADGALLDHAPVRALSKSALSGKMLVFTTQCVPNEALPSIENRLYLAPSRPIPISVWDYASPDKVKESFGLGAMDAAQFLKPIEAFLENSADDR